MVAAWAPDAGDLVWMDFDPQAGHEQAGRRPALILSSKAFNARTSLAFACPVTSKVKSYPFHLPIPQPAALQGVVLCEHLRSVDWRARHASFIEHAPDELLSQVRTLIATIAGLPLP